MSGKAQNSGDFTRKLRGEAMRYCKRRAAYFKYRNVQNSIELVVSQYLQSHPTAEYSPALVSLTGPLIYVLESDSLTYMALERLVSLIGIPD
jgi:hypothetical protein